MQSPAATIPVSHRGDPPWEIATLFPEQGFWTEVEYFRLPNNRLVEFDDGMIEVLPVPKKIQQRIVVFILNLIQAYIAAHKLGGVAFPAGYKIKIPRRKFRDPDVIYMNAEQDRASGENFTDCAQLVVEIVSEDDPDRDYTIKREEYALAGVPEYWIIDPQKRQFLVLVLEGAAYREHGCFIAGQTVTSKVLPELQIPVDQVPGMK